MQAPGACVGEITRWLGLPVATEAGGGGGGTGGGDGGQSGTSAAPPAVERDTNRKYELAYCDEHLASPSQRRSHCAAAEALWLVTNSAAAKRKSQNVAKSKSPLRQWQSCAAKNDAVQDRLF